MATRPAKYIINVVKKFSTKPTTNNEINPVLHNRNPRNLERLRLDRKPTGYPLEKFNVEFWHKLDLRERRDYVIARLIYNTNKVVVEASTNEWGIYKQLHSKQDRMAYIALAKVFAERCQETGIYSFFNEIPTEEGKEPSNAQVFLKVLEDEGLMLYEMPQFDIHAIWYKKREKRPWTVLED